MVIRTAGFKLLTQEWQKYPLHNKPRWDGLKMLLGESFSHYTVKILLHVRPLQQLHFLLLVPVNKLTLSCRAIKDYIRCSLCKYRPPVRVFHQPICATHASWGLGAMAINTSLSNLRTKIDDTGRESFFVFPTPKMFCHSSGVVFRWGFRGAALY